MISSILHLPVAVLVTKEIHVVVGKLLASKQNQRYNQLWQSIQSRYDNNADTILTRLYCEPINYRLAVLPCRSRSIPRWLRFFLGWSQP